MMMNHTLAQLRELKLAGMAAAVEEQLSSPASTHLSFEERLALMVDREVHQRADKRHAALLVGAAANVLSFGRFQNAERFAAGIGVDLSLARRAAGRLQASA
jgi:hypothetical protein